MTQVPKGDYPPRDAEWLDAPSVLSSACIFCGFPMTNNHHHPPRGRFHKSDEKRVPKLSVCGGGNASGCHGLLHHNGGTLTPKVPTDARYCYAVADEKATAEINKRRKKSGLHPVKAGVPFMARATDGLTDAGHTVREMYAGLDVSAAEGEVLTADRYRTAAGYFFGRACNDLAAIVERTGVPVNDYIRDTLKLKVTASQLTKYRGWGSLPECAATLALGVTRGYGVSRMPDITMALETASQAADPDAVYTWRDFDSDVLGVVPPTEKERCEACGSWFTPKEESCKR